MGFVLVLALPTGVLIGAIGIGGVLLPPALIWLGGLDPHAAAGTSTFAFLFTGLVGTIAYARRGAMPWRFAGWLTVGAAPAAAAGALVNGIAPAIVLHLVLALVTAGSGIFNLVSHPASGRRGLPAPAAVAIGAVVGFGSALTGTGGPVLLVPGLLALGVEPLLTVAAGQLISLPLVAFASLGYASSSLVHYRLAAALGALAAVGVVAGAALAHRLPRRHLHRIASGTLVAVGAFTLVAALTT
ncbi:sulfite exporter TauE/SafE family protein [Actinoplanes sp. TBRC 11911]|uniref:sulfite exporter TauE/SafE family protein n=1 Tax=Actinoplanes sp. TBRC 11911 TaxID=2729386 RepID=UPI00145DA3F0|nr:sulfite exporter TauE/SafE family protein [Actinoplanes sp. TBRC 11911]NMO52108.1 sulfite exporter TauE/SafE family protein [Actinoplanes sp. TBRC 11911]